MDLNFWDFKHMSHKSHGGGRGRVCVVGVVVTHQSLFCFTGLEFLNHKVTQLAEERYSGTTLLFLLSQAGGYDGDWLPLLPQHG